MLIRIGQGQAFHKAGAFSIDPSAHTFIAGKSGVGKSVLLGNIAVNLALAGRGFALLDPHGDLYDFVLANIPSNRVRDVVLIDPMDSHPVALNLFDGKNDRRAIDNLASIIWNVWPMGRGPRSEWILENGCRAILEAVQRPTVLHLNKFVVRADYRRLVRAQVSSPDLHDFFHVLEDEWDRRQREEALAPLANKTGRFVADTRLRDMMGQSSSLDFGKLMDGRRIILCRLSRGQLGTDVSSIIGSVIVSKIVSAALEREAQPPEKRVPFSVLLDEAQAFSRGVSLDVLLPEARKYKIGVFPTTQSQALLPLESQEAIYAGCSSIVAFRISGKNAERIAEEFGSGFPASAIQTLSNAEAYGKTVKGGIAMEPLRIKCDPPLTVKHPGKLRSILSWSRTEYGSPREEVEQFIHRLLEDKDEYVAA